MCEYEKMHGAEQSMNKRGLDTFLNSFQFSSPTQSIAHCKRITFHKQTHISASLWILQPNDTTYQTVKA